LSPENQDIRREAWLIVVRINAFSYAANVSYASLNIMLLTDCKYKLFSRQLCGLLIFVKFCAPLLPLLVAHGYLSLT